MARRGVSISFKLIGVSTVLVLVVTGLYGTMGTLQLQRTMAGSSARMADKISDGLQRAGLGQLKLLAETTRIALLQNDYTTLQSIALNVGQQDDRVVEVGVVDPNGVILSHSDAKQVGTKASGLVLTAKGVVIQRGVVRGTRAISFVQPVFQEGSRIATAFLAYSLRPLTAELDKAKTIAQRETTRSLTNMLVVGLLAVLVGVALTVFQGLRISRPIQALARQADRIAGGDLAVRVPVNSHDEIGLLGDRFNYMADQVLVLMRETMEKATMEKELEVASVVQSTLVPDASTIQCPGLTISSHFRPATRCGGDWWSYNNLPDDRTLVIVGDVTGHGVASAMITAVAKGAVSASLSMTGGQVDLEPFLNVLNTAIRDAAHGQFVMTCFASVYDPKTRTLTFSNAGHNFPYLYRAQTSQLAALVVRGNRLGDTVAVKYIVKQMSIEPGDVLVWYTDGVVECEDARGEEFGERRFRSLLRSSCDAEEPAAIRDTIVARTNQFYGDTLQKDDITLVIGKFA